MRLKETKTNGKRLSNLIVKPRERRTKKKEKRKALTKERKGKGFDQRKKRERL